MKLFPMSFCIFVAVEDDDQVNDDACLFSCGDSGLISTPHARTLKNPEHLFFIGTLNPFK